jgi:gas vesicle protein
MAVVAGLSVWELAALAAAAVAAMFTATPQGQEAAKKTAQAISDLAQPADESDAPATPDAVQDCPYAKDDTNDKCKDIYQQIYAVVNELQERIEESLEDTFDLYNKAYDTPNPDLPTDTTWLGHLEQEMNKQNQLNNLIRQAERMGCPVPQDIKQLGYRNLPKQPRGN